MYFVRSTNVILTLPFSLFKDVFFFSFQICTIIQTAPHLHFHYSFPESQLTNNSVNIQIGLLVAHTRLLFFCHRYIRSVLVFCFCRFRLCLSTNYSRSSKKLFRFMFFLMSFCCSHYYWKVADDSQNSNEIVSIFFSFQIAQHNVK